MRLEVIIQEEKSMIIDEYRADSKRYDNMIYRRCGRSGIKLPVISLGLWHNFGYVDLFDNSRAMVRRAFDLGITHFDLANNYGPPAGSAEENFGRIMKMDMKSHRDEMIISTKAGYHMWNGPYGDGGSKKYLVSSLDQSLKRMDLEYVDIFYHHRPDPETPLEETMKALDLIVRQGKALYVGISNYDPILTKAATKMLKSMGTPFIIHQAKYSMFQRKVEEGLLDVFNIEGLGSIVFSPLAQGLLTNKYLGGIPSDSRAGGGSIFLKEENITPEVLEQVRQLNEIANNRDQSLAQMALAWVLRHKQVTSALIGASKVSQIEDCVATIKHLEFIEEELQAIETILSAERTE